MDDANLLRLDERAGKHFDELANATLASVVRANPVSRPHRQGATVDERHMTVLGPEDVKQVKYHARVPHADGWRLQFNDGNVLWEVRSDGIHHHDRLVSHLLKLRSVRQAVRPEYVEHLLREWLADRLANRSESPFAEAFLGEVNQHLHLWTIAVPIPNLWVESKFELGGVTFDGSRFTKQIMNELEGEMLANGPGDSATIRASMDDRRRRYQGVVCGVVELVAVEDSVGQTAAEVVEAALQILRLFSPSAIKPLMKATIGREGQVFIPGGAAWVLKDGRPSSSWEWTDAGFEQPAWNVTSELVAVFRGAGLGILGDLLTLEKRSSLQEALVLAIGLLDESVCCNDFKKKVALALTSAESLLLDTAEPIQGMLAMRCAFLTGRDLTQRLEIDALIREAYRARSKYVHHGRSANDEELVARLTMTLVDVFVQVARIARTIRTQEELIELLKRTSFGDTSFTNPVRPPGAS